MQHWAGGLSGKAAVLCGSVYSWALHSADRAGIVGAWKLICFCFPKLDFRAFDVSFNFPFCKKDGALQEFNTAAGDFYNLVSEFYF